MSDLPYIVMICSYHNYSKEVGSGGHIFYSIRCATREAADLVVRWVAGPKGWDNADIEATVVFDGVRESVDA